VTEFDRKTVGEFRANGGRAGGALAGTPLVLLHHIGARSGIEHVTPLAYSAQGDDRIASTVELGTERFTATAEEQAGPARAELWLNLVAQFPDLEEFAARTERTIPLFILRRATS
jgi:F420H(2)-dependent quinone reductase